MNAEASGSMDNNSAKPIVDVGFRPQLNMEVTPPRPEDLQKSYATIVSDYSGTNDWYGGMSM